jgi:HD-GYP domain-containing protein (c-di-GMP phosphodiesterase class II)
MRRLWQKDELTFLHSYRVTKILMSFVNYSRIEIEKRNNLELGSLLHDIGKIKVRAAILRKKGKLLEHEYEEMKRYPQLGAAILEKYPLPEAATKMALSHHERWDGNGYPYGLKGKEIPLEARMLALADSLEAMTGIRPYRSSLSWEEAYEEIAKRKGTQFDPELTSMFLKWMEYEEIPMESGLPSLLESIVY